MKKMITWLALVLQFGSFSYGQVRCNALVERNVYEVGETFTLTVELSGSDLQVTKYPELPSMEGIQSLYANAGESTSISIVNGKQSITKSYQYLLKAGSVGKWVIPPVPVEVSGKVYRTQAVTVEVVPAGSRKNPETSETDVFLAMVPSKKEVFVGEETDVSLRIYTRVNVTQYSPKRMPTFVGFWAQDFDMPKTLEPGIETINGIQYRVYTIKRTALFPTRSGQLTIDPAEIECELRIARRSRGSLFDDFFSPFSDPFGKVVTTRLTSQPLSIKAKELPDDGKPAGFTGLVGSFEVTSTVDKQKVKTGEAMVYKLALSGTGNLMSMTAPPGPFSDDFEKYEPKVDQNLQTSGGTIKGTKSFEFVAVPRAPRLFEIPPFEVVYFDPGSGKYVSKWSPSHRIEIEAGSSPVYSEGNLSKEEVALLSRDIRFIQTDQPYWRTNTTTPWFIAAWCFPLFAWIGVIWHGRRKERLGRNPELLRYRKASPLAKSRLKKAERLMKDNHVDTFYAEMSRILSGFVTDKLGLTGQVILSDDLQSRLRVRGVEEDLIIGYVECLNTCDEARFAPDGRSRHHMDSVYGRIRDTILALDKAL